jgi:hypothetical protein
MYLRLPSPFADAVTADAVGLHFVQRADKVDHASALPLERLKANLASAAAISLRDVLETLVQKAGVGEKMGTPYYAFPLELSSPACAARTSGAAHWKGQHM